MSTVAQRYDFVRFVVMDSVLAKTDGRNAIGDPAMTPADELNLNATLLHVDLLGSVKDIRRAARNRHLASEAAAEASLLTLAATASLDTWFPWNPSATSAEIGL